MGSQNPVGTTATTGNALNTTTTQGWFTLEQPQQGGMAGMYVLGYPWAPGQPPMPYPQILNHWYPYHPGQ